MATPLASGYGYSGQAKHRLSYGQVKKLAQAFGLPGDAIAQIAKGESSLYADIQQHDPGDGMVGYGLLQMTPNAWGKGSAAYKHMQSLGGIEAMKDPLKNMAMARFLYKSAGNKLTPWYGTRFLTNRSGEGKLGPIDESRVDGSLAKAVTGGGTASAGRTRTTTTTTPGVDNSLARLSLVQSFLDDRNSDPVDFAVQARGLKDIAPVMTTKTVRLPGASAQPTASGAQMTSGPVHSPVGRSAKVIGTPYAGTHTLGNWQSDNAVDISVPVGTPMVALQDGVVVKVRHHPQGAGRFAGDQITIKGANGNEYFYAHGKASVKPGQRIRRGQKLGTTGSANGVEHLHFGQMKGDPREHT